MKTNLHFLLMLVVACASIAGAQTNENPMANYQVILDRLPFGLVAAGKGGHGALGFGRYAFIGLVSPDGASSNRVAVIHDRQTNYYYFKAEGEQIDDVKVMRLENAGTGRKLLLQRGADIMTLTYAEEVHQGGVQLNPFGPPPAVVTTGEGMISEKKSKHDHPEKANNKDSAKRKSEAADRARELAERKRESQQKSRFKR
jgi:hypothetical protein